MGDKNMEYYIKAILGQSGIREFIINALDKTEAMEKFVKNALACDIDFKIEEIEVI